MKKCINRGVMISYFFGVCCIKHNPILCADQLGMERLRPTVTHPR